ncbi:tRNA 2-selenouridine(34) synthase MnmH [Candidatus Woesearchaeota archaeon]|mgnify:CR=1 FL=1|nr:MAG: tRNA 2-selenouridine(34) synthase MnmH [Candidatus Woesearchaeota archaeon]
MVEQITIEDIKETDFLIDVRSEKEFEEDHIPGSINMPILDNLQRHIVGYTYKQVSKDEAYKKGYDILEEKINDYVNKLKSVKSRIVIYCFRGGMRSRAVVEYLNKRDVSCYQLKDGYKAYRENVLNRLKGFDYNKKKVFILHGLTGTAKTKIINKLDEGIDLEGLANHRSSLFGAVGLNPNTQKWFDSQLILALEKSDKNLIFEGESLKIGDVFIHKRLFDAMDKAIAIKIEMSLNKRVQNILDDYFDTEKKIGEVKEIIPKLAQKMGNKWVNNLLEIFAKKDYEKVVEILLTEYYDLLYAHFHKHHSPSYEIIITTDDIDAAVGKIKDFIRNKK